MFRWLQSVDERLEATFNRWSWTMFFALMALFIAVRSAQICYRPVWFDELSTYYVSRTFALVELPYIITHSGDSQPPVYHLLNMPFLWLLGDRPESIRWMSLTAAVLGLSSTYYWLKRSVSPGAALAAVAFLCASSLAFYSTEARPYAIWFCFVSLGMATSKLPLRVAFFAAGASVHFFGAVTVLPLALAEQGWRRRLAYLPILLPAILSVTLAPSIDDMRVKAFTSLDLSLIPHTFAVLAGTILYMFGLPVALLQRPTDKFRQLIVWAVLLAGGSLGVLLLFTRLAAAFQPRYCFPLLLALALFMAWCVANSRFPGLLVAAVVLAAMILIPVRAEKSLMLSDVPLKNWLLPYFSQHPYRFVTDSYFFTGLSWHLKQPERSRLYFAYDSPTPFVPRDPRISTLGAWVALEQGEGRIIRLADLMTPGQPFVYLSFQDHRTKFRLALEKFPVKITPLGSFELHELLLVEPLPQVSPQSQTGSSTAGP